MQKLGVIGEKTDPRTLKLMTVFRELPPIPAAFDVDSQYPLPIPTPMFRNGGIDALGDCVIAARAHQTLRFESYEQKKLLPISDKNVTDEYFSESGGADTGLYLLDSLKCWRDNGWRIGASQMITARGCWHKKKPITVNSYTIYAFGAVEPTHHDDVKATAYLLNGVYIGLALPVSAQKQQIWDVVGNPSTDPDSKKFSWGGHCVYICGYDDFGLTCVTWGAKKRMTWAFFDAYCFDCFGVVDNRDKFLDNSPVDVDKLDKYLDEVQA